MPDEDIAREQARLCQRAMDTAGLQLEQVWWHYFSLGGEVGMLEVEAYLHHAMSLPRLQRDMLAHAVNELINFAPSAYVPYASELAEEDEQRSGQQSEDQVRDYPRTTTTPRRRPETTTGIRASGRPAALLSRVPSRRPCRAQAAARSNPAIDHVVPRCSAASRSPARYRALIIAAGLWR